MSLEQLNRILVPVDFSPLSGEALRYALSLAEAVEATVEVAYVHMEARWRGLDLHVISHETDQLLSENVYALARQRMTDFLKEHVGDTGQDITQHLVEGQPEAGILGLVEARAPDLIVMASHGRHGIAGLMLGSVTRQVLRRADIPVLSFTPAARVSERV